MNKKIVIGLIVLLGIVGLMFYLSSKGSITGNIVKDNMEGKGGQKKVVFESNMGDVVIALREDMPITVGNFVKLVEEGYYDGTRFHRVINDFMIQGGDPLSKDLNMKGRWGTGGPGYNIEDEFVEGSSNVRGSISMANTGTPNSGGSQFFINLADNTFLDWDKPPEQSRHPAFGNVVEGMDVVDKIAKIPTGARDIPEEDVIILKARVF